MKFNFLKPLLTKEITYDTNIPLIRRQLLLSKLLFIIVIIFSLVTLYHIFLSNELQMAFIDSIALGTFIMALLALHKYKNFNSVVTISNITLFISIVMFILIDENNNFGLIWSIFFPIFSILTMGYKKGIIFTALFYLALFYLAYSNVGEWQDSNWDLVSFLHFAIVSTILTYSIYSIETAQEGVHKELKVLHEKEKLHIEELECLTVTDPLTSLYNRRHLTNIFKREFYKAKRHNVVMAFYILDIDFFKQYNDTYGHKEGDDVLVCVSSIIKEHFKRGEDFIFRLGGEEFGGLITGNNIEEVQKFIAELCVKITDKKIEHIGNSNQPILSVSIGMNIFKDYKNDDFNTIYKNADSALYEAKESGRDKAVLYTA